MVKAIFQRNVRRKLHDTCFGSAAKPIVDVTYAFTMQQLFAKTVKATTLKLLYFDNNVGSVSMSTCFERETVRALCFLCIYPCLVKEPIVDEQTLPWNRLGFDD